MPISNDQPSDGHLPQLPYVPGLSGFEDVRTDSPADDVRSNARISPREDSSSGAEVDIAQPDTAAYLGKTFGGYQLEAKIGQGGMGTVYKGRQVSLDRIVAVKILNKALYENREFIKRFEREAKSIAKINHPNIVAVYDFGVHDGLWYMVNEFIEGQSLSNIINDRLVVAVNEVVTWMVHCLAGLAHVAQGVPEVSLACGHQNLQSRSQAPPGERRRCCHAPASLVPCRARSSRSGARS